MCDLCYQRYLLAMPRKEWLKLDKPEADLTAEVEDALNYLPGICVWQAKKRGGVRAGQVALCVPDLIGFAAPRARFIGVETKRSHRETCRCASCEGQREWGAALVAAGGVYIANCRSAEEAVEGVTHGLDRAEAQA